MERKELEQFLQGFFEHDRQEKLTRFRVLNTLAQKGKTLFTGSSLMEQFPIAELLMDCGEQMTIYNRGVGGFTTTDMLDHMEEQVFGVEPSRIFINIGTNDIGSPDYRQEALIENYRKILTQIKERLPQTQVNLLAYYPVNKLASPADNPMAEGMFKNRTNANIHKANEAVKELAGEFGYRFLDVNDGLTDGTGRLKKEFTVEGIHMYANGYAVVLNNLLPYLKED